MTYEEFRSAHRYLLASLQRQAAQRDDYPDLEWIEAEHVAMANAANEWAETHGLEPRVTTEIVARIEQPAVGHSDYAHKFALYVAEYLYTSPARNGTTERTHPCQSGQPSPPSSPPSC